MDDVREIFGDIDIYLFDQIQKGRFTPGMRVIDAGCGGGRNLIYLMRMGCDVFGIDQNPSAVERVIELAGALAPDLSNANFQTAPVEKMPFPDKHFDWVIRSAVLHFAESKDQFDQMVAEMWRVLKPGGKVFVRLASTIGIEGLVIPTANGRYNLPDGSERFLVDQEFLLTLTKELGATLVEPIKTTNVQNLRCMTTWVVSKSI
jgi:ubiquinone/menaquinone biosynthesis C-methylase UbiE